MTFPSLCCLLCLWCELPLFLVSLADHLSSSLFGTMDGGMKDKDKGMLCHCVWFGYCIVFLTLAPNQVHWISMIYWRYEGQRQRYVVPLCLVWILHSVSNTCSKPGPLDFNDIFNDNGNDKLPNGSGLKKRVAGTMMEADVDYKKK